MPGTAAKHAGMKENHFTHQKYEENKTLSGLAHMKLFPFLP